MHALNLEPPAASSPRADRLTKADLVAWFESGCKPRDAWRIGTEHEKFGFRVPDHSPLPYDGSAGVRALLDGLTRFGWCPVTEAGRPIALQHGAESITLEPGGQVELSGAPLPDLHQTCREVHRHFAQLREVGGELGLGFLGIGFTPSWTREQIHWMPKERYEIMRRYMPTRGALGLDMMVRTATVQVNLDYSSEADILRKLRLGLALQPVATALFANSPFSEGRPNGFLSYRSHIWTDTDPDRTGILPFVFEPGMGFERWVDYALGVPMYFAHRDGRYVDARGQSFSDFLGGRLPALPGQPATLADWELHVSTVFPEVRLKRYLEMRGADSGSWQGLCALPALWVGLCYDATALAGAWDLVADWTAAERSFLRTAIPRTGLRTPFRGGTVADLARTVVDLALQGLARRDRIGCSGTDERQFLAPLEQVLDEGRTPAERLLEAYRTRWGGSVDPIFDEHAQGPD